MDEREAYKKKLEKTSMKLDKKTQEAREMRKDLLKSNEDAREINTKFLAKKNDFEQLMSEFEESLRNERALKRVLSEERER